MPTHPSSASAGVPRQPPHASVLFDEVLDALQPRGGVGFRALDGTVGAGGHAFGLLERSSPDGQLVGLDADPAALELARARLAPFGERVTLLRRNFSELGELELAPMNALVLDLGLSSMQLDSSGRGFSFRGDEPLDMRFDPGSDAPTAADLLNAEPEAALEKILREYGEEPRARRVVREIVRRRPLARTGDLLAAVTAALGPARGRIHPATRTFQAMRIAVNDELGALEAALDAAIELLAPAGRIAVISFHSLEDRIVKWRFRGWADQGRARVLTKRPLQPSDEEIHANPRARSAKLRIAERTPAAAERTAAEAGRTAADAERTAADAERTAADAGRTAAEAGRTAADAERTPTDAERTAADSGRTAIGTRRSSNVTERTPGGVGR